VVPEVKKKVIDNGLCIGCGICVSECPSNSLKMKWNHIGIYEPTVVQPCNGSGNCINVCPFNPDPEKEVEDENKILYKTSDIRISGKKVLGYYNELFIGYSVNHRENSSSGGIATWILQQLLEDKVVDAVYTVGSSNGDDYFGYKKVYSIADLLENSKTKYYPVNMESMMEEIENSNDKVAITAVPCYIKAIKLKLIKNPVLCEKIIFTIGIICGGMKSKYFTDYLLSRLKLDGEKASELSYRNKDYLSSANDYSFSSKSNGKIHSIKMKSVGDMWGTGLFKPNACDFCDDIFGELADVSVGDAWLPPYVYDGKGNNVVISRSGMAQKLLNKGKSEKQLILDKISYEQAFQTQRGNYNHRRIGLRYRLQLAKRQKIHIGPKRENPSYFINPFFILVQRQRIKVRSLSFRIWSKSRNAQEFDKAISPELHKLTRYTKIYHLSKYFNPMYYFRRLIFLFHHH